MIEQVDINILAFWNSFLISHENQFLRHLVEWKTAMTTVIRIKLMFFLENHDSPSE